LPAETVDVVISNCVVNLSTDKPAVFRETFRVLKPGGRIGITDVVAEDQLSPADRAERGAWVGCIAGALSRSEYEAGWSRPGSPACRWPSPTRRATGCTRPSSRHQAHRRRRGDRHDHPGQPDHPADGLRLSTPDLLAVDLVVGGLETGSHARVGCQASRPAPAPLRR
jgi:SAM-dependent methyltransferase